MAERMSDGELSEWRLEPEDSSAWTQTEFRFVRAIKSIIARLDIAERKVKRLESDDPMGIREMFQKVRELTGETPDIGVFHLDELGNPKNVTVMREVDLRDNYDRANQELAKLKKQKDAALEHAEFGGTDGAHHKAWVIDQIVRALTGDGYAAWVADMRAGQDGPETYDWDEGIPP